MPLVVSFGVPVAKMSGRGLAHTGGTIDKLESIKGYQVERTKEEFIQQVEDWINNLLRPMFGFKSSLEMAKIVS